MSTFTNKQSKMQIIHCPVSALMRKEGMRGTTWIIEKSKSCPTDISIKYSICHPKDQFSRKKGVATALSSSATVVSKVNLIRHINNLFSHKESFHLTPSVYELYQAVVRT